MASRSVRISLFFLVLFLIGSISYVSSVEAEAEAETETETEPSEPQAPEFVVTLDHSNFTDFVSRQKFIVVEFYAPWCGHCKNLAPEFEKAASILSKEDPPLFLAKVDADAESNKALAAEFDVRSYPTIKIFRYGGSLTQEYKGPRVADGIVEYVKKQSGPASSVVQSSENVTSHVDAKEIVIVGIFPEFSGDKFENFTTLAERLRADYEFRHTSDAKLLPGGDLSVTGPVVRLFKPFDELVMDFEEFDTDALQKLVEEASIPTVTVFDKDPNNHPYVVKFFSSPTSKAMLFVNFTGETFDAFKSKYEDVAKQFKGKGISFLIGDVEVGSGAFQYFGLKNEQTPLIFILDEPAKYLKTNLEPDQIMAWISEFKDGKLQQYKKSEPIPEVNNEPVKVVVADSLEDMVFKSGKNVLLEFYAPWCGHCKKLAPILDEVAVSFEKDAEVVIAKMDATANDVPEKFNVQGFPTLYLKSASGKLVEYDGDRTKEDIIEFIQKNKDSATQQESDKDSASQQESNQESASEQETRKDEL